MYKTFWYFFIFISGVLFKLIDDLIDMKEIFPNYLLKYQYILKILLIIFFSVIMYYNKDISIILFGCFIWFYLLDIFQNSNNLDNIYWFISAYFISVFTFYYILKYNYNDFFLNTLKLNDLILGIIIIFITYVEISLFLEETSSIKILSRIFTLLFIIILLKFNNICRANIEILLILIGYLFMSIINLSIFYNKLYLQ